MVPVPRGRLGEKRLRPQPERGGSASAHRKPPGPRRPSPRPFMLSFSKLSVSETGKENSHSEYTCARERCSNERAISCSQHFENSTLFPQISAFNYRQLTNHLRTFPSRPPIFCLFKDFTFVFTLFLFEYGAFRSGVFFLSHLCFHLSSLPSGFYQV